MVLRGQKTMKPTAIITMCQAKDFPEADYGFQNIHKARPSDWPHIILLNDEHDEALIERLTNEFDATVICQGNNLGIAAGRNLLIREAVKRDVSYIFSIDNDFMIPTDFFEQYMQRLTELEAKGPVGITMPAVLDFNKAFKLLWSEEEQKSLTDAKFTLEETNRSVLDRVDRADKKRLAKTVFHMGTRHWRANYFGLSGKEFHQAWSAFDTDMTPTSTEISPPAFVGKDMDVLEQLGSAHWQMEVDTVPGGVCCYPTSLVRRIGGTDELFSPFGYEDAEFSIRALKTGARNMLIGDMVLFHDFKNRGHARSNIIKAAGRGRCRGFLAKRHVDPNEWSAALIATVVAEWKQVFRKSYMLENRKNRGENSSISNSLKILFMTLSSSIYGMLAASKIGHVVEGDEFDQINDPAPPSLNKFAKTLFFLTRQVLAAKTANHPDVEGRGTSSLSAENVKFAFWANSVEDVEALPDLVFKNIKITHRKGKTPKLSLSLCGFRARQNRLDAIWRSILPIENGISAGTEGIDADTHITFQSTENGMKVSGSLAFADKSVLSFRCFGESKENDNEGELTLRDLFIEVDKGWLSNLLSRLAIDLEYLPADTYETALSAFLTKIGVNADTLERSEKETETSTSQPATLQIDLKGQVLRIVRDTNDTLGYKIFDRDDKPLQIVGQSNGENKAVTEDELETVLKKPLKRGLPEKMLRVLSIPGDPLIRAINKTKFGQRFLGQDPFVEFKDTYDPTELQKTLWRTKYRAASRGIALSKNERMFAKFHNKHRGERCFIVGNGPSLLKNDLSLLKNEITFGVNAIYLNEDTRDFLPTHYVVEDIFVAEDRAAEINAWGRPHKWIGNYLRHCMANGPRTTWINVNLDYRSYPGFPHFSTDAARMVYVGGTVSFMCMQMAYFMGFDKVYLIGFDHSYEVKTDVDQTGNKLVSQSDDPNHFHKDYFGKGYRWHTPRVDRMEMAYINARKAFEADGREMINATTGGHLNVLKRTDYDSLFD